MFNTLEKYKSSGHFFFTANSDMATVCNAPTDEAGVYVVYGLSKGKVAIMFIGSSGQINDDGSIYIHKGGIKDRLVNAKQNGKLIRDLWVREMKKGDFEALDIYWFVTCDAHYMDDPEEVEEDLLDICEEIYGDIPKWNRL